MKTKWYFFILTVVTVSVFINNYFSVHENTPFKVGVLMIGDSRLEKLTGLKKGLKELGYEEDAIDFEVKNAKDNQGLLDNKINELLKKKPDLIVTLGGVETIALKEKMEEQKIRIPVVFAGVAAPKETGIIEDYRSPGGLFTGINNFHTGLAGKRLELFHELVPSVQRFHVLYDKDVEVSVLSLENTIEAAADLSLQILPTNVSDAEFEAKLSQNLQKNDALLILPGFRIESLIKEISQFSKKYKIPVMGIYGDEVEEGFLASYGTSFFDQGYQAARYVSLIIQGNSPADIPVELPDSIRFIVNPKIKDELGIELNNDLMDIADFIDDESEASQ
ncbi:ABC transporter substrate-binding protein [Bacillus sp. FJAT-49705]|uniref:ABC transporter substrate-binding protein n=1 Tax=Cytobacillus citreus TaxID=2833586 RepID=A0ABS5NWH0_9BACI|nr:ABC transporter substrate-binding protein [Cytobacillus citreus]MBS4192190.1 ABC transporter substrate-binding protein [Cytobacillus citreus]